MNYEVVELEEKIVAGISARTSNDAPDAGMVIGSLWGRFFEEGIFFNISNKVNEKSIGLYSDYNDENMQEYQITVGCEVSSTERNQEGLTFTVIPKGKYAKFIVRGHMQKAVTEFWIKLWKMDLNRSFTGDFEEYQPGGTLEDSEIHMYIALKE